MRKVLLVLPLMLVLLAPSTAHTQERVTIDISPERGLATTTCFHFTISGLKPFGIYQVVFAVDRGTTTRYVHWVQVDESGVLANTWWNAPDEPTGTYWLLVYEGSSGRLLAREQFVIYGRPGYLFHEPC